MKPSMWLVVLAAGYSRRMGTRKLLLPIGKESMLRYMAQKALQIKAAGVVVVVNAEFPELAADIQDLPLIILSNQESHLGMSSSLRLAVDYLTRISADAGCVLLADQPGIDPSVIDQVLQRYENTGAPIVQAAYQGKPSHPVLFGRSVFPELQQISGDQGGREIIKKHSEERQLIHVQKAEPEDIDVYEDYQRLKGRFY
ncbi:MULTISPECIES: nucleotidyltransferase family protein [unclassified Paenibacillus]|uniref:nucleotidyltransferase family protein n=1 Tax=unclassified Paenibacillus TaxID=185978 RepID=UPI001AE7DFF6|nr:MULTISPECIES: nucleotidyltransferase family protein [unclassified Paenibacillus]MBP1157280.1 molybdenum cofactor cytidylyltransferase [Paenibacillus sp. PvP091]MBP1171981.1 molybdenum cofactor cytidylyltransferase [Paenibacillus sp. PvR098]MBP2438362.1 molybdenum cofactor cytidylyltransferase [Paenibacillus sp. PvP052]